MSLVQFTKRIAGFVGCSLVTALMFLWFAAVSPAALAGPPALEFDVPLMIGGRYLPLKSLARDGSSKDLIEVVIPITAHVRSGSEKDLKQCLYTLTDPSVPEMLAVTDWLPRTELKTMFAKPIQFNHEQLAKIGINLSAHYVLAATSEAGGQLKSGTTYEMLPPQEIVLASGTVHHGHGIFFELKPSSQTTIEGMRTFSAILRVPRGWRGGCLKLECEAVGAERSVVPKLDLERGVLPKLEREVNSGLAVFYLALYVIGDAEAEQLAEQVAMCQQELFDAMVRDRQEMRSACHKLLAWPGWLGKPPRFLDKLGLPAASPSPPSEVALLNYVLDRATTQAVPLEEVPPQVQKKLRDLQEAAERLQRLSVEHPRVHEETRAPEEAPAPIASAITAARPVENARKPLTPVADVASAAATSPERQSVDRTPEPKKEQPAKPKDHLVKKSSETGVGPRDSLGDSGKETRTVAEPSPLPAVGSTVQPLDGAKPGNESTPPSGESSSRGPSLPDLPKQAWYFLASMWGALFTYIVAPLIVEYFRVHLQDRRIKRAKRKRSLQREITRS